MERHFTFPVLVAAAIHGGLFFGWQRGEAPASTTQTHVIPFSDPPPQLSPPEEPEVEVVLAAEQPKGTPDAPPRGEDTPQTPKPYDITIPITEVSHSESDRRFDKIPLGPIGFEEGDIRVVRPTILASTALDNPPRTRSQSPISYPYEAKSRGLRGTVTVEFTVDENGRVLDPRVIESTDRVFEAAAVAGVAKWRFEPGRREGRIVRFRMAVPIQFSLNE